MYLLRIVMLLIDPDPQFCSKSGHSSSVDTTNLKSNLKLVLIPTKTSIHSLHHDVG